MAIICTNTGLGAVDVHHLKKENMLIPGSAGTLEWSMGDYGTGSIRFEVESTRLLLKYRYYTVNGEWDDIEEPVRFD